MPLFKKRRRDYHGMTYHADSKRQRKQERSGRLQKILNRFYMIIIFGTLIWLAYFILFTPIFKIKEIELINGQEIEHNELSKVINNFLDAKKYKFLLKRNFFVLNKLELEKRLREEFFLSLLVIEKDFPNKLIINFKERASSFNLCLADECFRVDYLGNVLAKIEGNKMGEGMLLVSYRLESESTRPTSPASELDGGRANSTNGEDEIASLASNSLAMTDREQEFPKITPGVTKIPKKRVMAILDLYEIINKRSSRGVAIESMEIYDIDGLINKIVVNTKDGFQVFFNEEENLSEQVDNLFLILSREIKSNIKNIEYIDLRFGDKIYYK